VKTCLLPSLDGVAFLNEYAQVRRPFAKKRPNDLRFLSCHHHRHHSSASAARVERRIVPVRDQLGARSEEAIALGPSMTLDGAIDFALQEA
jgi:hypothetical protein